MSESDSHTEIERSRSGDRAALESLLVRHLKDLEGYLRLRMGPVLRSKESCSDLVQSVCREVLGDLDRFEYRGEAAFKHWLYTRAMHKLLHRRRDLGTLKRDVGRERALSEEGAVSAYRTLCTPTRNLAARETAELIERAFDGLPEDYQEAITMRRMMGLDYAEIARLMGRSEGAVRNLVYRGVARLTMALDSEGYGAD